jgi:hypothetical protein
MKMVSYFSGSHNVWNRWKKDFSQLLNVHTASDVGQTEIHAAESLIPDHGPYEVDIAI